jgi:hypothetical protein
LQRLLSLGPGPPWSPTWAFSAEVPICHSPWNLPVAHIEGFWTQGFVLAKQALCSSSHTSSSFCSGYFGNGMSWTICSGWPWATILLISASQVARIIGVSHQCPAAAKFFFFCLFIYLFVLRQSGYVIQASFKLVILLPHSLECWDYRCALPHQFATKFFLTCQKSLLSFSPSILMCPASPSVLNFQHLRLPELPKPDHFSPSLSLVSSFSPIVCFPALSHVAGAHPSQEALLGSQVEFGAP